MSAPTLISITSVGVQTATPPTLEVNGTTYSASVNATLAPPDGLIIFIDSAPYVFSTFDPSPFSSAAGQLLEAEDGQTYCIVNSTNSIVRFALRTGSGPMAPVASTPSMVELQPSEALSFVFSSSASTANPTLIGEGCIAPVAPPISPLDPMPTPLYPLDIPLPTPLSPLPTPLVPSVTLLPTPLTPALAPLGPPIAPLGPPLPAALGPMPSRDTIWIVVLGSLLTVGVIALVSILMWQRQRKNRYLPNQ